MRPGLTGLAQVQQPPDTRPLQRPPQVELRPLLRGTDESLARLPPDARHGPQVSGRPIHLDRSNLATPRSERPPRPRISRFGTRAHREHAGIKFLYAVMMTLMACSIDRDLIRMTGPGETRPRPFTRSQVTMMRRLNLVFLAILLAVVAVFGGGMHLVHGFQIRRNASALLDRARRAEAGKDLEKAEQSLSEYLNLGARTGRVGVVRPGRRSARLGSPAARSGLPGPRASPPV